MAKAQHGMRPPDWGQMLESESHGQFKFIAKMEFPFDIVYPGVDAILNLFETYSYVRFIEEKRKSKLFAKIREIVKNHADSDGAIAIEYVTRVYILQRM